MTYLIELVRSNNLKHFIRRLKDIHRLDGCLGLNDIVNILEKNNIAYRKYEITDYDFYKKKGSKLDCATSDLVILEITNPNHNQHLEIEIDKVLDSVVDLWLYKLLVFCIENEEKISFESTESCTPFGKKLKEMLEEEFINKANF